MRVLLLCLFALAAASASAQTNPLQYRPLAVGDTWVYEYLIASCTMGVGDYNGGREYIVLRDTVISGDVFKIVRSVPTRRNGSVPPGVVGPGQAALRYLADGTAVVAPVAGDTQEYARIYVDSLIRTLNLGTIQTSTPGAVQIGDVSYPVDSRLFTYDVPCSYSVAGSQQTFATGIGLINRRITLRVSGTQFLAFGSVLRYALVGGVVYGMRPPVGEDAPAPAATFRAYPNPARAALTVEADGAVRVFDALGRLVATGTAAPARPLRLDVSAWPAGVYVARTDAGQAVRLVVAR